MVVRLRTSKGLRTSMERQRTVAVVAICDQQVSNLHDDVSTATGASF